MPLESKGLNTLALVRDVGLRSGEESGEYEDDGEVYDDDDGNESDEEYEDEDEEQQEEEDVESVGDVYEGMLRICTHAADRMM